MTAHFDKWCDDLFKSLTTDMKKKSSDDSGCCGGTNSNKSSSGGCGCHDDEEEEEEESGGACCGSETSSSETSSSSNKKKPLKTIKGVPKPKKTKAERRQVAADKGDVNAAALTGKKKKNQPSVLYLSLFPLPYFVL
jgi:hypothetical protein